MRLRLWLLILPLLVAGTQVGTAILDRLAPPSYESVELFSPDNESHALLPVVVALGAMALVCAVVRLATSAPTTRRHPAWAFAGLPPLIFTLQEHVEYVVGHGHIPWLLAANPVFLFGLGLQAPLAVVAYAVSRALVGAAVAIAERRLAARARWRRPPLSPRPGGTDIRPRPCFLRNARLTRGPPHALVV